MNLNLHFLGGLIFIYLIFLPPLQSQGISLERMDEIPVSVDGVQLSYPFTGGMSMPRLNNIDLNGDGMEDLILFEPLGNKYLPFVLKNKNGVLDYDYHPEYETLFPAAEQFLIVVDFDGDGLKDIVTSQKIYLGEGAFRFYKGVAPLSAKQQNSFVEMEHRTLSANQADLLKMHSYDIPTMDDINNDGDLDLLLFPKSNTKIHYLENQSIEMGYGTDSLIFDLYDDCWGKVEYSLNEELALNVCPGFVDNNQGLNSCAGSYLMSHDFDVDGDKDVLYSTLFSEALFLLDNGGDSQEAHIKSMDPNFIADIAGKFPYFPGSYLLDVDNDNDLDVSVVTSSFGLVLTGSSREEFYLFHNVGNNQAPDYQLANRSFLVEHTLDDGFRSSISSVDYNDDGLLDLVVASNNKHPNYNYQTQLNLYENNGSAEHPSFIKVDEDFLGISEYHLKAVHPVFGDLDQDGDQDLILGDNVGRLIYLENTSVGNTVSNFQLQFELFEAFNLGSYARPQIIDLDRDGLSDVVVGTQKGKISFLKNIGSATNPAFEMVTDTLGHIYTKHYNIESTPYFFELPDSVGYFMMNSLSSGNVELYRNIDGNLDGPFEKIEDQLGAINLGNAATVHLADLNQDGQEELLFGNQRGGLNIYSLKENGVIATAVQETQNLQVKYYPNPTNNWLYVEMPPSSKKTTFSLYSATGTLCGQYNWSAPTNVSQIDISTFSPGLYFGVLQQSDKTLTQKIIIKPNNK